MVTEATVLSSHDHVAIAWELLAESDRKLAGRERLPASETLWKATAQAVMAVATHRGWPCDGSRLSLRMAVERLAEEEGDALLSLKYIYAENFRDNAELDFMESRALAYDSAKARDYIRRLLAIVC